MELVTLSIVNYVVLCSNDGAFEKGEMPGGCEFVTYKLQWKS